MEKLVLVDGHSILNRAFYGVPMLTNAEGLHTNAVFGFLNILFKILEDEGADHLAVAFDLSAPTFRHEMYAEYKGTRHPMPQELVEQVPLIQEGLRAMQVPILTLAGYEADDILGTVAKRTAEQGIAVSIVSGDRDLLQLADEKIQILLPKTVKGKTELFSYFPEDVKAEYQVTPEEFIAVKALMGDASDNIPGVPSIGQKTATNLIVQYHSLGNLKEHLEEVKPPRAKKALEEHWDLAEQSYELARICTECPIAFSYEEAKSDSLYTKEAYAWMQRLGFKALLSRFSKEVTAPNEHRPKVKVAADFSEAEKVFEKALQLESGAKVGFELLLEEKCLLGLSLCLNEKELYVIPSEGFLTESYLAEKANALFAAWKERKVVAAVMNLKPQLSLLALDWESPVFDMGVAAYLLNPLKDGYSYDDLARDYLSCSLPSRESLLGKKKWGEAWEDEREKAAQCLAYSAYTAWRALPVLLGLLEEQNMKQLFGEVEMPLIYSLHRMEQIGIAVKKEALGEYGAKLASQIEKVAAEIYEGTGETFNLNSPKQLGEVLFEHMGMKGGRKTKNGYSTAADVLEKLAVKEPLVRKILEYRQLAKLKSTYADGLAACICADGRIHGTFNQTITATGRISSTEPNLQNIPIRMELGREIRRVFVPREGYVFVDADYSQIELRVLAHMSEDERLIEAYQEAQDIHTITASQVFHTPLAEVTALQRRNAKAVNFGIVYGISAFGLSEDLSISRKEALEYIEKYFATYPRVKQFLDGLVETAKKDGYVSTMFHRRRPVPELKSGNAMQRAFGERVAMNSPIQGTAADIIKIAMIEVDRELCRQGLQSRIVLQVHDELLVEAKEEELEIVKQILSEKMKGAAKLKVPLEIDTKSGYSWFETK
ncbi:MAG: DNA polymerase I [bacterium]|nr:DNA polymerase I [bacterium]